MEGSVFCDRGGGKWQRDVTLSIIEHPNVIDAGNINTFLLVCKS